MAALLSKIPAVFGMFIALISFTAYIESLFTSVSDTWIVSAIFALFSMPFFFIDAVISFVKARKKMDAKFNYILASALILAIPAAMFLGGDGNDLLNLIWNIYYLMIFVLEIVSIKKAVSALIARRKQAKETARG